MEEVVPRALDAYARKGEVHHQRKYVENAVLQFFKTLCPASKLNITKEIFQYERCTPRGSLVFHIAVGFHPCDTPAFDLYAQEWQTKVSWRESTVLVERDFAFQKSIHPISE